MVIKSGTYLDETTTKAKPLKTFTILEIATRAIETETLEALVALEDEILIFCTSEDTKSQNWVDDQGRSLLDHAERIIKTARQRLLSGRTKEQQELYEIGQKIGRAKCGTSS